MGDDDLTRRVPTVAEIRDSAGVPWSLTWETSDGPVDLDGKTGWLVNGRLEVGAPVDVYPVTFPTRSERIRNEARARLASKRRQRARLDVIDELAEAADFAMLEYSNSRDMRESVLAAVVHLHSPNDHGMCDGCDADVWSDSGDWPCRTIELIAERFHVDLPE